MATQLVHLTYGGGLYDRTQALANGRIQPEGLVLNWVSLPSPETFWRMIQFEEFDASELSCANYFTLRSRGDTRFIAIPVFPSRTFRHSAVFVNRNAGIRDAADLKGKRVGVAEYPMTAAVWVRAFLQHDYGVSPSDVRWVTGGLEQAGRKDRVPVAPRGVRIEAAPSDRSLVQMLEDGELDALVSVSTPSTFGSSSSSIARLFPDYPAVEAEYYQRTGFFPIMHTLVLRREVYERHPWAAVSLYKAFSQAKEAAIERMLDSDSLSVTLAWTVGYAEQEQALFGPDIWPYGFEENRRTLEALKTYLNEQGLLERDFPLEEAFAPSTLSLSRH